MNGDRELRALMADYLDGLLEGGEKREAETRIAAEPEVLAEVARMRAVLYRPYAVPAPAAGQEARILNRFGDRPLLRVMRYAAVFAAGVLTTLLVQFPSPEQQAPVFVDPTPVPTQPVGVRIENLRIR